MSAMRTLAVTILTMVTMMTMSIFRQWKAVCMTLAHLISPPVMVMTPPDPKISGTVVGQTVMHDLDRAGPGIGKIVEQVWYL